MVARTNSGSNPALRPSDGEIDMFGLTHQGHRRGSNQDHFLIATIHADHPCPDDGAGDGRSAMGKSAEELARLLVGLALGRGGSDNLTIVIAQAPITRRG